MNWNDIGDQELAGMLEQAVMHGSNAEFAELATRVASRLRRASDRHGNLSRLVFNTSNQKERFTDNSEEKTPQVEPNNDEPPYDKYDGVLPADIGTDRP